MREPRIPLRGGGVVAYGPSRLRWVERRWPAARGFLVPAGLVTSAVGVLLMVDGRVAVGGLIVALVAAALVPVAFALIRRPRVVITGHENLTLWRSAEQATATILRAMPALEGLVDTKEADGLVRRARWEIACLLRDRMAVSGSLYAARSSTYGLAPEDPLRGELALRRELLEERAGELGREVRRRVDRLETMAKQNAAFAFKQKALRREPELTERARRVMDSADSALAGITAERYAEDPAGELAEQMTAVLAAYRELSAPVTDPGSPG